MTDLDTTEVLTPEDQQELNERAGELDSAIRDGLRRGRQALWDVAEALYEFDEIAGWIPLGCETKTEWLADPEVSMTSATYYRLVSVYRELAVRRHIDLSTLRELDVSKVAIVLPKLQMGKVTKKEALNDAEALASRDLREKYMVRKPPQTPEPDEDEQDYVDVQEAPAHPSEEMWIEVVDAAHKRKRGLVKYIEKNTDWELLEDASGDDREDWVLPAVVGAAEEYSEPSEDQTLGGNGDGLRTPETGSEDRQKIDKAILSQAVRDWRALENELIEMAESGQTHPRITVGLIRPGVQGARLLMGELDEWGND